VAVSCKYGDKPAGFGATELVITKANCSFRLSPPSSGRT
jgi:hypothetical protein